MKRITEVFGIRNETNLNSDEGASGGEGGTTLSEPTSVSSCFGWKMRGFRF